MSTVRNMDGSPFNPQPLEEKGVREWTSFQHCGDSDQTWFRIFPENRWYVAKNRRKEMNCFGDCQQGRKPCNCELEADQGEFISPAVRLIENSIAALIVITALVGMVVLLWEVV